VYFCCGPQDETPTDLLIGTGTPVGDPIEFQSIETVFASPSVPREEPLTIASVKGNIGHLEGAAGVASLIKVCLMLQHSTIPPQANFTKPNPNIGITNKSNILIPTSSVPWKARVKVACINNYGAAGSNAAMIVCQPPESVSKAQPKLMPQGSSYPIMISGDVTDAVEANREAIIKRFRQLQQNRTPSLLASIAYGLATSQNRTLSHAMVTTVPDHEDLETALTRQSVIATQMRLKPKQPVVLCFGGQVSSSVGLDHQLFASSALLQRHLWMCDSKMRDLGFPGIFPAIFQSEPVEDPVQLHGMLFALQYSTAKAWLDCGLQVDAVVGHSFGQLTALTVAGALDLSDGLRLVCGRAQLISTLWGPVAGAMVAVEASAPQVQELLSKLSVAGYSAEIACYNAKESQVLVGTVAAMDALQEILMLSDIKHKRLPVTHGFHSAFTQPILSDLKELAQTLHFQPTAIPLETCTEQDSWLLGTPELIVKHTRDPVYFLHAIERLSTRLGPCTWVEASTGASTPAMIKRSLPRSCTDTFIHANLRSSNAPTSLAEATASLWRCSQPVQFWPFHMSERGRYAPLNLPGYQFRRTKHWLEWQDTVVLPEDPENEQPRWDPEQHDLISFSSFKDVEKSVAKFSVDPKSQEYMLLVQGHAVVSQPLCPAPLYCELAIRAVKLLSPENTSDSLDIQGLQIHTPLGLEPNRGLHLEVRTSTIPGQWNFTMMSSQHTDDDTTHASGRLKLNGGSASAERELSSYQRLVGHQKIEALVSDPDCDALKGSATYKAFDRAVTYSSYYKGVQAIYGRDDEACGKVEIPLGEHELGHQGGIVTPLLVDNFVQIAGLQINVLGDCESHLVYVCTEMERIIHGPGLHQNPYAKYEVYSKISRNSPKEIMSDIVVFDHVSHTVECVVFGARFTRVTIEGLRKALLVANGSSQNQKQIGRTPSNTSHRTEPPSIPFQSQDTSNVEPGELFCDDGVKPDKSDTFKADYLSEVKILLHKVSDVPIETIKADSTLDDLGIDSLMVMEVQTEVHSKFQLTIPNKDWATLESPRKLATYLERTMAGSVQIGGPQWVHPVPSVLHSSLEQSSDESKYGGTESSDSGDGEMEIPTAVTTPAIIADFDNASLTTSSLQSLNFVNRIAQRTFSTIRTKYDSFAAEEGFDGFWSDVYPTQKRLTLAYVIEAFATMGCDLRSISVGQALPKLDYLPQHESLVRQLHVILADSGLVVSQAGTYCRTEVLIENLPALDILTEIIREFPQYAEEHRLLSVTGSRLGDCLRGRADPLRLLFMDRTNKGLLESVYANGPMYKAMSRLLGSYILETVSQWQGSRPLRILEIGGGTGGTTRHVVKLLQEHSVEFSYCFSDVSRGLVANAKRTFSIYPQMDFVVLDIEDTPPNQYLGQFDLILSTNCIHATKSLQKTTDHMRQILSPEGFTCLVEFTRNIFWFDLVFGLLEGWWLYEDGRTHVLADEHFWNRSLRAAGYGDVQWTEGDSEESRTLRLIVGFNVKREDVEPAGSTIVSGGKERARSTTIRWKQAGTVDLMADIYMPSDHGAFDKYRPVGKVARD
jgi:acyl transferase domain-containing protein/acyl carrier protein/SAM-dependent methyltransferase